MESQPSLLASEGIVPEKTRQLIGNAGLLTTENADSTRPAIAKLSAPYISLETASLQKSYRVLSDAIRYR